MQQQPRLAIGWASACVMMVAACALLLARGAPIQTDLLALLPPTERNPVAERAVNALSAAAANRAVFLVTDPDSKTAKQAARDFAAALRATRAFASVRAETPSIDPALVGRVFGDYRFGLLADRDRQMLASGRVDPEALLVRRLSSPLRLGATADIARDPFGFLDQYMADLPYRDLGVELEDGLLLVRGAGTGTPATRVLATADLAGSAFDNGVQRAVLAAVDAAERAVRGTAPGVAILRTGAVFYAGAARESAEREMRWIAAGSITGIAILLITVFRSLRPLLLGLLTVGVGLAAATTATLLAYDELHLFTLVFGATLIGEAIDYSIQYFAAHAAGGRDWDPQRGLRTVRPGLVLALSTSLLGYAALLLVPFPAVNQIALFALTGLAVAYLCVVLLLPMLLRRPYGHDMTPITRPAARLAGWWRERLGRPGAYALALAVLALCAPGWLLLHGDDDVRTLTRRPAALLEQEKAIRALTGLGGSSQFFLVEGATPQAVLRREEALGERLRALADTGAISHYHGVFRFVPSGERQRENRALLRRALLDDTARLGRAFDSVGFAPGTAGQLVGAFRDSAERVLLPEDWLASPTAAPFRHLWLGKTEGGYASIVLPFGFARVEPLANAAAGIQGVALVDKAASASRLLHDYRIGFSAGLALALAVVLAVLSRRYGWRGGGAVLLPALLGMAVALGAAGYAGFPLTLFTVMGLMLVLGVGVNYAIFLVEGRGREGTALVAVLLSAATTLLSFGLLAFSSTPALAQFGATLLTGICCGVLLAPLALTLEPRRA